jgi:polysaccharide export outer membrane protein
MAMCGSAGAASGNGGKGSSDEYVIGKSDVLEINVWREQDLTRTITVRKDGRISLPLVDEVRAAGQTSLELKKAIEQKLSDYIDNPVVTVIVQEQASRKYYIIGEVVNTGEYPLMKDLTVLQAIALAGGFTEWADKDDILLLRRYSGGEQRLNIDYEAIVAGKRPEQNKLLRADDTIIVR